MQVFWVLQIDFKNVALLCINRLILGRLHILLGTQPTVPVGSESDIAKPYRLLAS